MSTRPTMHAVKSSNVESIGHDGIDLWIDYKSGGTYRHAGVPAATYEAARSAPSVGSFLHAEIKGKYPGEKME